MINVAPPMRRATPAVPADVERDAERYRWLRGQHWSKNGLCVVENSRSGIIQLGAYCPSMEMLDNDIDAAMQAAPTEGEGS